ncbi:hypothetical protein VPH35_053581 [Triticum aestivum]|uniref:UBA domain-containing protein n=1 Tax=Triticum aestivum TaxID=4565 RepID=A0A3B6FS72_WHEAT
MSGGLPGFHNAPVSRAVVVAAALFSVPFGLRSRFLDLGLSHQNLYENLRIWRVIASLFAFSSSPELIFGVALLYYFRVFERQIGSNKYAVFIIFSMTVSVLLQILALGYLKDPSFNPLTSGPYGLIFASYVPFFFDIPISTKFRIFGLQLCDKSFVYLAGLQVPEYATSLFSRLSWPFSNNSYQRLPIATTDENIPDLQARQMQGVHTTTPDPTESSIATLVSMGFDRASAIQALALTTNDVNLASNILLEAQST